jgi:hypothetical protein
MCELFLNYGSGERKKAHKDEPALYFFESPQKGTSLDEGSFVVERWLWEERRMHLLEGVLIFLCERPLVARGSFRMSICRGRSSSDVRRNNGRKDGQDYREGQKIAMKNGTEGRFISRGKHCDDLLYCRGNACGWHRGGRKGLSDNAK